MPEPVSKIDKEVSKIFDELKSGVGEHSITQAMNDLNRDVHNMSSGDWNKFSTALQEKIKSTNQLLPELTILATEQTFAPELANGHTVDESDLRKKLGDLQTYADQDEKMEGKTSFKQFLLQSFLDDDYNRVKDETTAGGWGTCVSKEDLDKALAENNHNEVQDKWGNDAITQLEKNDAGHFRVLADENMDLTEDSIRSALKKDDNAVAAGLPPTLDAETRALASDMLDDKNKAFDRFGDGDTITLTTLNDAAANKGISVDDLRADRGTDGKGKEHGAPKSEKADRPKTDKDGKPLPPDKGKEGDQPGPGKPGKGGDAPNGSGPDYKGEKPHDKQAPPVVKKHSEQGEIYRVHRGDTLTGIARHRLIEEHIAPTPDQVKKMISEIAAKNGIENINLILDGQVLHI